MGTYQGLTATILKQGSNQAIRFFVFNNLKSYFQVSFILILNFFLFSSDRIIITLGSHWHHIFMLLIKEHP